MVCFGTVRNGVVVPKGKPKLREGTRVRIEVVKDAPDPRKPKPVFRLSDLAVPMGVPDLAAEDDHYLYGTPKRTGAKRKRKSAARPSKGRGA